MSKVHWVSMLSFPMLPTMVERKNTISTTSSATKSSMQPITPFSTSSRPSDLSSLHDPLLPDLENGPGTGVETTLHFGLTCSSRSLKHFPFHFSESQCSASIPAVSTAIRTRSFATDGCNCQLSSHSTEITMSYLRFPRNHTDGLQSSRQVRLP